MRIMCVDNNLEQLHSIMECCRKAKRVSGVVGFTSEEEALAWLRGHPCDIALMATLKPGFDGLRLAADASKIRPEMAVVFVTDDKNSGAEALKRHAVGYLVKPTEAKRVIEEIEYVKGVIEERRSRRLRG